MFIEVQRFSLGRKNFGHSFCYEEERMTDQKLYSIRSLITRPHKFDIVAALVISFNLFSFHSDYSEWSCHVRDRKCVGISVHTFSYDTAMCPECYEPCYSIKTG